MDNNHSLNRPFKTGYLLFITACIDICNNAAFCHGLYLRVRIMPHCKTIIFPKRFIVGNATVLTVRLGEYLSMIPMNLMYQRFEYTS